MNHDQFITLRDVFIQACEHHLQSGGRIINRYYSISVDKGCCPLFCLLGSVNGSTAERLTELLGFEVSHADLVSFLYSFDQYSDYVDNLRKTSVLNQPMMNLGTELYTRYVKPTEEFRKSFMTNPVKE
jgi:hypothetical protein